MTQNFICNIRQFRCRCSNTIASERYDSTGYPQGLAGNDIPKLSRLLAIVDSFDVMTHDRVYKKAMSVDNAVHELKTCSGKQFDPRMAERFIELLEEHAFDIDENSNKLNLHICTKESSMI